MANIVDFSSGAVTTTDTTPATAGAWGFPSGQAATGEFVVLAHGSNGGKASWKFGFLAYRSGEDITIINQLLGLVSSKTANALLWDAYLDEADGNIELKIKGANNVTIKWAVDLQWGMSVEPGVE